MLPVENIEALNIHDSVLIQTVVLLDSVEMTLDYIEDYDSQNYRSSFRKLIFQNCTSVQFNINVGFHRSTQNSLLTADEWKAEEGRAVRIETNTTAGIIDIVCQDVFLSDPINEE